MDNNLIKSIGSKQTEHEYYTNIPKGYKIGKTKYVVIFGTVMSGLGKGIFSSSLGKLLSTKGLKISPVKFDGYLNQDAGTLNPYRHGEVFVLEDGTECDMDLGTYERFLNISLSKNNYLTSGKIFNQVLSRERKGKYLGRDVQFIPHVTGEIKRFLRDLAMKSKSDLVFVEVGGTVGDIENMYFIEAMRELAYEEGKDNVCFVSLTYVLEPGFLGEQKSKAAQLGLKALMSLGIQPDIIACRANNPVTSKVREKISIYSNVPMNRVVSIHDCESIYEIPFLLKSAGIDESIEKILKLKKRKEDKKKTKEWQGYIRKLKNAKKEIVIGMTGKYTGLRDSYASILNALEHSGTHHSVKIKIKWIDTTKILNISDAAVLLKNVDGIIVPGGFGKRGAEGKIKCIEYVRKKKIPFLGLCYGFQMAVAEYARNVCNLKNASSTEIEPNSKHPVIDILPEQKKIEGLGGTMRLGIRQIDVKSGSIANKIYKSTKIYERFRHRFECNPDYIEILEKNGLNFSGKAPNEPIMQILELSSHPFFVATQFHPEFTSRPIRVNPLFYYFISAIVNSNLYK